MHKLPPDQARRMKWWLEARFGMFIHWGLYTAGGLDCWMMHDMGWPVDEYVRRFEPRFTAEKFDPDAWMALARSAGCRYVVLTSRHHEGYCLWDTDTTPFSAARMTPRRDMIREYVQAARKAKLRVGVYYSLLDWRYKPYWMGPRKDPRGWDQFVDYVHAQIRELMTRYGKIDILWYDGAWPDRFGNWGFTPSPEELAEAWRSRALNATVRQLQPDILINDRASLPEDFGTPEQTVDWFELGLRGATLRPWELCDTLGDLWGASPADRNRKTVREVVTRLITCVSRSGNMLLNIGPKSDGGVQTWQQKMMERIGQWVHRHKEGIYGCEGEWQRPFTTGLAPWRVTRRGNHLFLHLLRYPGRRPFSIANLHNYRITAARLLDTHQPLRVERRLTCDVIEGLPARSPDPIAPVVRLDIQAVTATQRRSRRLIALDDKELEEAPWETQKPGHIRSTGDRSSSTIQR